jgi:23S rRNA pseudouridine1911/1915/1917 synthase
VAFEAFAGDTAGAAPAQHGGLNVAIELTVGSDFEGQRLDRFLTAAIDGQSRSQIQHLIADGRVRLRRLSTPTGTEPVLKANMAVREGDEITVELLPPAPSHVEGEAIALDILYEDADLVVINKPAGMVVHPGAGHATGTLVNALLHHVSDLSGIGGELRPGIVHRLDRGTSGVMVIAKNDAAHQELSRQFHDREVEKEYIALVWGVVQAGRRIDAPIGRDPSNRQKMSARARRAREAVTRVTRAKHLRAFTLCQVAIHTGRTHQIRVHLSAIGHPIVGDPVYGGVRRHVAADIRAVLRLDRPFLHAERLAFKHPRDGRRMEFTAPLPADLLSILEDLPGWCEDEDETHSRSQIPSPKARGRKPGA